MEKKAFLKRHRIWLSSLLLTLFITPFTSSLDLKISSFFYTPVIGENGHFVSDATTQFIFKYGEALGFAVGGLASLVFFLSWFVRPFRTWQRGALALALTWILGAGLLINVTLKDHWGRPRPRQVTEFGGTHVFRPYYSPDFHTQESQKSFPSGHAATGFYYFSLVLVGLRYNKRYLFILGLVMSMGLGLILSLCRIAQGGHFFSDTLFSALLMGWVALFVDYLVFKSRLSTRLYSIAT